MRKTRKAVAGGIVGALGAVYATALGRTIRGPFADGAGRDFLTGAAAIGVVLAARWAFRELGIEDPPAPPEPCEVCG